MDEQTGSGPANAGAPGNAERIRQQYQYRSISLIKAFACITVVVAHWKAFFASMGSPGIDSLVFEGPLVLLIYSSMGVSIFLMLSAALAGLKVYRGQRIHAGREVLKRYIRLSIPIFVTSLTVFCLQKAGLIFTSEAGALLGNDFVAGLYAAPLKAWDLFRISFFTALLREENSFYVPFWMMSYIFLGSLVSMALSFVIRSLGNAGKAAVFGFLILGMSFLDSYYLCITLGNLIAYLLSESEKRGLLGIEIHSDAGNGKRTLLIVAAVLLLIFGMWFSTKAYVIAWNVNAAGIGAPLNDSWFWQVIAGFCICIGFIWGWELLFAARGQTKAACNYAKSLPQSGGAFDGNVYAASNEAEQKPFSRRKGCMSTGLIGWIRCIIHWIGSFINWIGNISYEIFLTHWFIFSSFSCLFYLKSAHMHMHVSILLNFALTFVLILLCSAVYHELITKRLCARLAGYLERKLTDDSRDRNNSY
ncbi:MAG: acyltransferase family protein [Lachnospiraceae bacterium]|nr:acyltransferase family protein [Lachnospiraceae bacterium]